MQATTSSPSSPSDDESDSKVESTPTPKSKPTRKLPLQEDNTNPLNKEILKFRRNRRNGAQLAHKRLEVALKERDPDIDEKSFNTALLAYANQSGNGDWMAPLNLEKLLQKMKRHPTISPSVFSYNCAMEAWVKSSTQTQHQNRKQHSPKHHQNNKKRDDASWNQSHGQRQQAQQPTKQRSILQAKNACLRLFDEMTTERKGAASLVPNTYTYNLILQLYAKSPNPHDLKKAEDWFRDMKCTPDRQTFNLMFAAYANHGSAEQAELLLNRLIQDFRVGGTDTNAEIVEIPSQIWFHCVLKACVQDQKAQLNNRGGDSSSNPGDQADRLLNEMNRFCKEGGLTSIRPTATTYNHILNVHAQAGNTGRVEELLLELEHLYADSGGELSMAPDRITYTTTLGAYANQKELDIDGKAEKILQRMFDFVAVGRPNMSPTIITYNTMLRIWTKSGTKKELQKATDLLDQMQSTTTSSPSSSSILPIFPPPPPPNAQSYTIVLHGWSRTNNVREAGYKAENLLRLLEQLPPNSRKNLSWTTVYNSVITTWSKCGDKAAPQRVEALLNLLEDKCYESGGTIAPDKTTFLCIADTYAKARIPDAEQRCDDLLVRMSQLEEAGVVSNDLRSNRALYNSILNALAKSGQPSAKDKAEEILTMMQTSPNVNLRPDIVTYASVLDCHTKSGSPETFARAEEMLRFVEGSYRNGEVLLKPNAVFYSAILQAWAKSATIEGFEKAEWLLRRNVDLHRQGSDYEYTRPHGIMYNAVMDSIARSGMPEAGERAEILLEEMKSLYDAGDEEMKPTRRSFNAVMLAYRRDGHCMEKVERVLSRMEELADTGELEVAPNTVSYNTAMKAMVEDRGKSSSEALGIAANQVQALLDRMEVRSVRPDSTTYSIVIEAWLKCNNEKGGVMADCMLQKFVNSVDSAKDWDAKADTDVVWDVVNAYKSSDLF